MAVNELLDGEFEIWRNSQWRVTNMHLEEIARSDLAGPPYWIRLTDLHHPGTIEHVCSKTWVDPVLFVDAYREACDVAGLVPDEAEIGRALTPPRDELLETIRRMTNG